MLIKMTTTAWILNNLIVSLVVIILIEFRELSVFMSYEKRIVMLYFFKQFMQIYFTQCSKLKCSYFYKYIFFLHRLKEGYIHRRWLSNILRVQNPSFLIPLQSSSDSQYLDSSSSFSNKPFYCHHLLPCYLSWPEPLLLILDNLQCLHDPVNFRPCTIWPQKYEMFNPPNLFRLIPLSEVSIQCTGPKHNISHSTDSFTAWNRIYVLLLQHSDKNFIVNIQHLPKCWC